MPTLQANWGGLIAAGRGADEVTFGWTNEVDYLLDDDTKRVLQASDWVLREVLWSDDDDYFTTLQFEPARVLSSGDEEL